MPPHHLGPLQMRHLLVITGYFLVSTWNILFISAENSTATANIGVTSSPSFCPSPVSPLLAKPVVNVEPTCSLSSRPIDPAPEFLSFEEWKAKRIAVRDAESTRDQDSHWSATGSQAATTHEVDLEEENYTLADAKMGKEANDGHSSQIVAGNHHAEPRPNSAPRYHIPLIDRFNYASNECNARIQSSHKSAKSASSILSRKKDRYMLSPCHPNGEKRFVVVELCEDIRIDTVQLANFEFFSGVFKDIRVSAAHTYTNDGKGWTVVGEYTAKNIRGIQSFHPQKELSQFYRYIRIDFLSYYGTEYFCPVSLLRVYGLTQMEEWKSDVWKAEWEASQAAGRINHPSASQKFDIPSNVGHASASDGSVPGATLEDRPVVDSNGSIATTTVSDETSTKGTTTADITDVPIVPEIHQDTSTFVAPPSKEIYVSTKMEPNSVLNDKATLTAAHGSQSTESQDTVAHVDHPSTSTSSVGTEDVSSMESSSMVDTSNASENPSADGTTPQTVTRIVSTTIVLSSATPAASPAVVVSSGESVYRMIINRLANLEANQTLYARYFEEQGKMVNFRLERMEEDIGRLAAVVTSQQRNVAKIIEKHKAEIEYTQEQLVARVDHLAHEVMMEKRMSVAQLVLLMTVLVFMALTRGSRGEPIRLSRAVHRKLQVSGDWVSSWRRSRLLSSPDATAADVLLHGDEIPESQNFHLEDPPALRAKHSIERHPRRSSSQHGYHDLLSTPPRKSRNRTRSRHNSFQSRNHTPVRSLKSDVTLTNPSDYSPSHPLKVKKSLPLRDSDMNIREPTTGIINRSTSTNLRPFGRSISLTESKGLGSNPGAGGSTSSLVGLPSQRRLAKTAHLHEPKNLKSRRNTVNELEPNVAKTLLSPTIENPFTPATSTFHTMEERMTNPLEYNNVFRSDGDASDKDMVTTATVQAIRVPFPTPNSNDAFEFSGDEGMWVDEEEDLEASTGSLKRSDRFRISSPKRSPLFSSSPPGARGRIRGLKKGDPATAMNASRERE